jgi:hypothetical protein
VSPARFFVPENRLASAINQPDGKTVEAAVATANAQLALAAGETAAKIDERLELINRLAANMPIPLEPLYQAVREVAGLAGLANLPDLGRAAHTFCSQIDLASRKGALSEEQVQVNLGGLSLLRHAERFSPAERQALLDNLHAVLNKAQKSPAA